MGFGAAFDIFGAANFAVAAQVYCKTIELHVHFYAALGVDGRLVLGATRPDHRVSSGWSDDRSG